MKNNKILKEFMLFTVLPFFIPLFGEIDKSLIDPSLKWGMVIISAIIVCICSYKTLSAKENDAKDDYIQKSIRYAYSGAHEIIERKRDVLSHETEFNRIDIKNNMLPYDVHSHIDDICKEFKKVISAITQINNEFVSTTFIYRYVYDGCSEADEQWKWIGGREPISKCMINEFVKEENTTFYHIINKNIHYIFSDDKKELSEQGMYHLGGRDKMYNDVGSVFSIKMAFGNNITTFVEGIITVTTHGKKFTDNMEIDNASDTLRNMIIDEIFPYYRKLIETELGLLYIRHTNNNPNERG